jgi:uncharacterized protein YkwD
VPNTFKPLAAALSVACCLILCVLAAPASARSTAHSSRRAKHHVRNRAGHERRHSSRRSGKGVSRRRGSRTGGAAAPSRAQERADARAQRRRIKEVDTAATIAGVLDTPCPNTELTPEQGNLPTVRAAVLCLINHERAEHQELPLLTNADLEAAAESHARELIAADYFAHVAPNGETPVDRIRETGYIESTSNGYVLGENLAWGTYSLSTPASIVAAWIASPGHLANILETQYTETGIAIAPAVPESLADGAPGATYAQEFGVIIH